MQSHPQYADVNLKLIRPYFEAEALFPEESVRELANRLGQYGMTGFLVVRTNDDGTYGLVSGLMLYRAAVAAGFSTVPCLLRNLPEADALAERLREIIRSGRREFEEALAYHIGIERFGWTMKWIEDEFGRSEGHISEKLGLVEIYGYEPNLLKAREEGHLSDRAVVALRRVLRSQTPQDERITRFRLLANRLIKEHWPAAIAGPMVNSCLWAMDHGLPLPLAPKRGTTAAGLLKAEIEALEHRRDALLAQITELQDFAEALAPFWDEAHHIHAAVQSFSTRLLGVKVPRRQAGDEKPRS